MLEQLRKLRPRDAEREEVVQDPQSPSIPRIFAFQEDQLPVERGAESRWRALLGEEFCVALGVGVGPTCVPFGGRY